MKKRLIFIIPYLLFGCQSKANHYIPLIHYSELNIEIDNKNDSMFYFLDDNDINAWIEDKRSFFLYVYSAQCGACDAFGMTLKDYVNEKRVIFPFTYLSTYLKSDNPISLDKSALVFFKDGIITDYRSDFTSIGSSKDFETYLSTYIYESNISIYNSSYINANLKTTFNTYTFNSYLGDPKTDKGILQIAYDSTVSDYYFIDETKYSVSEMISFCYKNHYWNLVFNHEEINSDKSSLQKLIPGLSNKQSYTGFDHLIIDYDLVTVEPILS